MGYGYGKCRVRALQSSTKVDGISQDISKVKDLSGHQLPRIIGKTSQFLLSEFDPCVTEELHGDRGKPNRNQ